MVNHLKDNWVWYLIISVLFVVGFAIGLVVNDIPFFSWNRQVGVDGLASLILSIIVAFWIPISLSPLITNKRITKDCLIEETKECINFLSQIKQKIDSVAIRGTTEEIDRKEITSMSSRDLSMKLSSLMEQLKLSFERKSEKLRMEISERNREYWEETTGGELMSDDFKIDLTYCNRHNNSYAKITSTLKKAIHEINKY